MEMRFTLQNAPRLSREPISTPRRGSNISTHKSCVKDITYIERLDTDCHILTASSLLDQPHGCVICPIPYKASIPFKEPRANVHFYQINNLSRFDFTFTLCDIQQMVDGNDVSMRDFRTVSRWGRRRFGDAGSKLDSSIRKFLPPRFQIVVDHILGLEQEDFPAIRKPDNEVNPKINRTEVG